jgi:Fe-S cluster assembly scaffold protein SufB
VSDATATAAAAPSRARSARRALDDLGFLVPAGTIDRLFAGEPDWLSADRRAALAAYETLPGESNTLYTPYIDLRAAELADAEISAVIPDHRDGTLPADADGLIEIVEGRDVAIELSAVARERGVRLCLLPEALEDTRAVLEGGGLLPGDDRFAQLTRAGWAQGVVVDIPPYVRLDRPIVIRWAVGAQHAALLTRTILRLGAGAEASIVEELVASEGAGDATGQALFSGTTEAYLGAGATLRMTSLQELPENVIAFQHRDARIGECASLHWALAQLGGRLVRSRVDNVLEGDRSSVEQVEIVFGADEQLFDWTSYTRHVGRDTTGELLSKGVLMDKARTYLKGMISIEKTAIGTDSYLGEFGMNLSKTARSVAIPSLEIDQPDCRRAMHSSSVGPIDETQLFYLETRGIPPDEARKFIVLGFLEPVVARVPVADARDRLRAQLQAKWDAGTGAGADAAA